MKPEAAYDPNEDQYLYHHALENDPFFSNPDSLDFATLIVTVASAVKAGGSRAGVPSQIRHGESLTVSQ